MAALGITFTGLEELLKACEDCASEAELGIVNRRIVERSAGVVKEAMQKRIPVSADNSKSGKKGVRPGGHARPNVPVSSIKMTGAAASVEVGWKLSDLRDHELRVDGLAIQGQTFKTTGTVQRDGATWYKIEDRERKQHLISANVVRCMA